MQAATVNMKSRTSPLVFAAIAVVAGVTFGPTPRVYAAPTGVSAIEALCDPHQGSRVCYPSNNYPHILLPRGRWQVVRSMLKIHRPMHFGDFVWNDAHVPRGIVWVRVDLGRQLLSVFRDGHEIGSSVILYGSDGKPTPTGSFSILEKAADHYSHSYDAAMPYMLRLTRDGVAIHGSPVREGLATHGCIGVPLEFARLLFTAVNKGDLVVIVPAAF